MNKFFMMVKDHQLRYSTVLLLVVLAITLIAQVFYYDKPANSFKVMIIPVAFIANLLLTTILLYTGLKFKEFEVTFNEVFKGVVSGALVFACQYLLELVYLFLAVESNDPFHLSNLSSFSLFHLYHPSDLSFYLIYPLQTINLWEILYIAVIISSLKAIIAPRKYPFLGLTIIITYMIGLFTWILIVVNINLTILNK